MFTKKHFEAVADLLHEFTQYNGKRVYPGSGEVDKIIDVIVDRFTNYFDNQNDRFNREKFLTRVYKD